MLSGQFWPPPQQPWAPNGPTPQAWTPPPQLSSGGSRNSWSGRKRALIAGVIAVALIGGYLVVATLAYTFPFTMSRPAAASPAVQARPPRAALTWPAALPAQVRCGDEFQDASRRHVLLVDPHAEG